MKVLGIHAGRRIIPGDLEVKFKIGSEKVGLLISFHTY